MIIMIGDGMGAEQVELARLFAPGGELAMDRLDGKPGGCCGTGGPNLIEELIADGYEYVTNAQELANATAPNGTMLGFFGGIAMPYTLDQPLDPGNDEPTLAEMTAKAIEVLNRDPSGTMVETLAFDEAVQVALDFAIADGETLLVVTADHETGGLKRGKQMNLAFLEGVTATTDFIWGAVQRETVTAEQALELYAGIGDVWPKLTKKEKDAIDSFGAGGISDVLSARAGVSWNGTGVEEGDHTRSKVPVFAGGPGSELFDASGFDNTDVGQLLLDAVSGN